jgi:NAD+ synthase (glutamine-hydrolysing)
LNRLRLAAAALNTTPLDWDGNLRVLRAALAAAQDAGVGILCLPELCITGYGCEDMFFSSGVQQTALALLPELAADTEGLVACFGLPVFHDGAVYNAAAVACSGRLLGLVAKQHLAGEGIHYEPRWFRPWPAGAVATMNVEGKPYPIGDLLFNCGGVRIGLEICRDAWLPNRTGIQLAARGADVLLNPSASHFAFAKQQIRERFVLEGSRAFCVSYAYCNLLGNEAGRSIYDGGTLIASEGEMRLRGPRFSFADWVLSTAVVDVDATRRQRAESSLSGSDLADNTGTVSANFTFPEVSNRPGESSWRAGVCASNSAIRNPKSEIRNSNKTVGDCPDFAKSAEQNGTVPFSETVLLESLGIPGHPGWETGPHQKEEEFARSVPLALFDYLRKSRARGFVVSLSGGADSSAAAVMIHLMTRLAEHELGPDWAAAKLTNVASPLLTCVYQATRNSGDVTRSAARTIADATGAEFVEWNIDDLVDGYIETVANAVGRSLDWQQDDLALQNIQARARGPGAWLLANLRGAILLTTSNRSEAAVGYATMDGDTCGGLAPIAGIDKAFLLDWLKWMETTGPAGLGPLPALSVVNSQPPTAELRPPDACQTDEGDLMPYRVLDAIERAAIRDKLLPIDVFKTVRPQFPQHDAGKLGHWVERFFQLWCRNQWKRERYAPCFHLDDENLDPKTWCRFPILNGGFEKELAELRAHVRNSPSTD